MRDRQAILKQTQVVKDLFDSSMLINVRVNQGHGGTTTGDVTMMEDLETLIRKCKDSINAAQKEIERTKKSVLFVQSRFEQF